MTIEFYVVHDDVVLGADTFSPYVKNKPYSQ